MTVPTLKRALLTSLLVLLSSGQLVAETVALTGGKVHTSAAAGTLEGATVVLEDGKIVAVGSDVAIPAGARTIDVRGKTVTAGLFDSMSRIGLVEIGAEDSTVDSRTDDPRLTAAFDVAMAFNPSSTLVPINRIEGLTRALIAPQSRTSPIAGRAAIVHLGGDLAADDVLRTPAALVVDLGETGAERAGGSRAALLMRLGEVFEDARDFAEHRQAYAAGTRRDSSLSRLDLEALQPVLAGEIPVAVRVHRASDIETVLRFARAQSLRLVVVGGAEAWRVAPALAAADVPVVLDPLANLPDSFESLAATLENAARLHAAGVTVAFTSSSSHNGRNLKQAAGNAVAYGLPWEAGLAAITAHPARIWGVGDQCGSLEPGKDADVVVWDGDPLEVTTFAERVFIRGQEIPMVSRQTLMRDRYLESAGDWPVAYRKP